MTPKESPPYHSSVWIVIRIASYAQMTIGAGPPLGNLEGRVVRVQLPLVLLALANLVQGKLFHPLVRVVTAEEHLYELVGCGFFGYQKTLVL